VDPWGGLNLGETENKYLRGIPRLLIPRTTPRGLFAILTTHRRNLFSALEGLLRPGALASIGRIREARARNNRPLKASSQSDIYQVKTEPPSRAMGDGGSQL
jgi:hypothetical protein